MLEKLSNGHRALVLGLGASGGGAGTARFLADIGFSVTVTDQKNAKELKISCALLSGAPIKFVLGRHRKSDIDRADFIVKNPAVPESSPFIKYARKKGKIITNDADIFLALAPRERIIGVTGTKGKTTTTRLLAHALGPSARAVGIPGVSFFEAFAGKKNPRWIVAEFSSFDLEYITSGPHIAVFTSLFADHLNRYKNFGQYAAAKMNLLILQKGGDIAFLANTKEIIRFMPRNYRGSSCFIYVKDGADDRGISFTTIDFAKAVAERLGVKRHMLKKRLESFKLQPGCMETVRHIGQRVFINSTTATNPGSAKYVIKTLSRRWKKLAVIAGGEDKKFPESEIADFAKILKKSASSIVLLPGTFTDRLVPYLGARAICARSMQEAVKYAADTGASIVLAPAAASFNMFQNEFDRGKQFVEIVKKIV